MRGSERETFRDGTFCKWAGMLAMKHCVESYVTAADGCILTGREQRGAGQINKHRGGGGEVENPGKHTLYCILYPSNYVHNCSDFYKYLVLLLLFNF
jgi:hypothetical protein